MAQQSRDPSQPPPVDPDMVNADSNISNPFREPDRIFQLDQASQQQFVGESTCLAFGDRILQCLNPQPTAAALPQDRDYVSNPVFARQFGTINNCKFPERIRANLLVRVALRFIGQDYHFFLHDDFLQQVERVYDSRQSQQYDSMWTCKFFAVLALGEMYSTSLPAAKESRPTSVPGTGYFLSAVSMLEDLFEEPSIAQIENMLLFVSLSPLRYPSVLRNQGVLYRRIRDSLSTPYAQKPITADLGTQCFYSNALGRVKSAHMYSGMAVRLSTSLGLHRALPEGSVVSAREREHRARLWWTVYIFDRSTCSKLGQPLTIQDTDIDVEMPSSDAPVSGDQAKLGPADHLIAYINLAQITGCIMRDIYAPSSKSNGTRFVQNVRTILQKLRKWDAHAPASLRWKAEGGVPRPVASLQLHFNQCIILATRPILLYILKVKDPFGNHAPGSPDGGEPPQVSDTTKSLADSCIAAARTSNNILTQLFVENALATCGYFDAHHLFSSTLVLIISAITSPNASDSDAVQTAFQLLRVMRDNGNAAAGQYFSRLVQIQWSVSRLFARTAAAEETRTSENPPAANALSDITPPPNVPPSGSADLDDYDWSNLLLPHSFYANYDEVTARTITADPLDNPLLQAFLEDTDVAMDESSVFQADQMGFIL